MAAAPPPSDEALRLLVLQECDILDTPPDPVFDAAAGLAARLCGTPIALVSLVDADRQWFKARHGLAEPQTPRDHAFCAHAILAAEPFEVCDAATDPRFMDNPLVTGAPFIRFYAGFPITAAGGQPLGTICAIDQVPRKLDDAQRQGMRHLADMITALMEERRAAALARRAADATAEHLRRLALTDSVTGAFNRRGFLDQSTWCGTAGGALLLVEVDALTAIRDELGIAAAEAVVKSVTGLAQRIAGPQDVVGRLTASTLALFLPGSTTAAGRALAERLRQLVAAAPVDAAGQSFCPTVTCGVAPVQGPRGVEASLAAADAALVEARAQGGDQVVICARAAPPVHRQSLA